MQANFSFIMNIVLLGVILGMMVWKLQPNFFKKKNKINVPLTPSLNQEALGADDIIQVRKINIEDLLHHEEKDFIEEISSKPNLGMSIEREEQLDSEPPAKNIMLFLAAQGQNIFAGYDLLQTLLSCGLRYGDAGLFHRHQHASGQGPVLFSLAAATATGMFDLQTIGAMSVKGLCLFMELSGNISIDSERFEIFIQTAKQLAEDLHANLLDERQRPLTSQTIHRFEQMIAETTEL